MPHVQLVGKHILVVENDVPSRALLEIILEDMGCSFDFAVHGQEAVDKVQQKDFDAVLMDVRMPILTGYEATRKIREMHKNVPIIALTAHAMLDVREKCLSCGMNDYLTKPFEQAQLLEKLLQWTAVNRS
jgi:CheY-like chemotaxis protein